MKHKPMRMCLACRSRKEKQDLIRLVKQKDEQIKVDLTGKLAGRGAYVCKSMACCDTLEKKRILNRVFSMKIEQTVYDTIKKHINKKEIEV